MFLRLQLFVRFLAFCREPHTQKIAISRPTQNRGIAKAASEGERPAAARADGGRVAPLVADDARS